MLCFFSCGNHTSCSYPFFLNVSLREQLTVLVFFLKLLEVPVILLLSNFVVKVVLQSPAFWVQALHQFLLPIKKMLHTASARVQ